MLSIEEALKRVLEGVVPRDDFERVPLEAAAGRICAKDIRASLAMPRFDNSAMDGYVFSRNDALEAMEAMEVRVGASPETPPREEIFSLPLSGTAAAGDAPGVLKPGCCMRILTGAPVPAGGDRVVRQERVRVAGERVFFKADALEEDAIRRKGKDFQEGDLLVSKGRRLRPPELGLLAAAGENRIPVLKRLKVGVLSTGNEIYTPGETLPAGGIYNSNFYLLKASLGNLGTEVVFRKHVKDSEEESRQALEEAARETDLIVSTGGVSVGDGDYMKRALEATGKVHLWKVALKPGKPFLYGEVRKGSEEGSVPFFGLPGNPGSVFVTTAVFLRPFILKKFGIEEETLLDIFEEESLGFSAPADERCRYLRVRLVRKAGERFLEEEDSQGSGYLRGLARANGLAVLEPNRDYQAGERVPFLPFRKLFL